MNTYGYSERERVHLARYFRKSITYYMYDDHDLEAHSAVTIASSGETTALLPDVATGDIRTDDDC